MKRLLFVLLMTLVWPIFAQAQDEEAPPPMFAQLRIGHYAPASPAVDVYLDGQIILQNLTFQSTSRLLFLDPGAHDFVLTEAGTGVETPSEDVVVYNLANAAVVYTLPTIDVEAGFTYLIAATTSTADASLTVNLLNETEALSGVQSDPNTSARFLLLNASSQPAGAFIDGNAAADNIAPGQTAVFSVPAGKANIEAGNSDSRTLVLNRNVQEALPLSNGLIVVTDGLEGGVSASLMLTYGGSLFDFMGAYSQSSLGMLYASGFHFLLPKNPLTFFLPTDAAFAKLPPGINSIGTGGAAFVLLHHTVDGSYTPIQMGEFAAIPTLQGASIGVELQDDAVLLNNSARIANDVVGIEVENLLIYLIDEVLLPPDLQVTILYSGEITEDTITRGRIESGQRMQYTLPVVGGSMLNVYLTDEAERLDTVLRIYDSENNLLHENDDFFGPNAGLEGLTVDRDGVWIIEVGTFADGETGEYILQVSKAQ